MALSHDGTELETPIETHIGDLSEAYNVGVVSPTQEGHSRMLKNLIGYSERVFYSASLISSQSKTLKDLARIHAEIVERNAEIVYREKDIDLLAERAEVSLLTELAGSVSKQEPSSEELYEYVDASKRRLNNMIAENDAIIDVARQLVKKLAGQPPNLILNVYNTFPKSGELWAFVMIGIALQFVAVAIPAIMTYHWRKPKGSQPVQDYAYPTFLLGTCLLIVSIALCSYIIEATTAEQVFIPTDDYNVENIFRLQLQQNMGDQPFKTYVILNHAGDKKIRTSRYDPEETLGQDGPHNLGAGIQDDSSESGSYDSPTSHWDRMVRWLSGAASYSKHAADQAGKTSTKAQKSTVIVAVILCFVGFICQFVGLRALHWSATVIQLGITLLMTCIRAWIRRGISNQPMTFQLPDSDPNWIALSLGTACRSKWPPKDKPWPTKIAPRLNLCNTVPEMQSVPCTELISSNDSRIQLRRKLQSLSTHNDSDLEPYVRTLLSNMRSFYKWLDPKWRTSGRGQSRSITWSHIVESSGINDSGLRKARLNLTMSFDLPSSPPDEQELFNRSILHALLSVLGYQSGPISHYRCITRVSSQEDWIRKRDFLQAQFSESMADGLVYDMYFLSTTGQIFRYNRGKWMLHTSQEHHHSFASLSITGMQPVTGFSSAGRKPSYGYLLAPQEDTTMTNQASELLAGLMDGVCQETNPKYDPITKTWYVVYQATNPKYNPMTESWNLESQEEHETIHVSYIVNKLKNTYFMKSEMDARLLVVSSLARCTVWKDSVRADEPTPESIPLPKPSSLAAPDYHLELNQSPYQKHP